MTNSNTETFDSVGITNTNANSGNTYSDGNNYPPLRYLRSNSNNPISKPENKRGCAVLSPCEETDDKSHKIQAAVEQSVQQKVPQIFESLGKKIIASIQQTVNNV